MGDKPIKNFVGSSFYEDSELYGPTGGSSAMSVAAPPTGGMPAAEEKESQWEKLQRDSALRRGLKSMQQKGGYGDLPSAGQMA
jgi:hypothetical protein